MCLVYLAADEIGAVASLRADEIHESCHARNARMAYDSRSLASRPDYSDQGLDGLAHSESLGSGSFWVY